MDEWYLFQINWSDWTISVKFIFRGSRKIRVHKWILFEETIYRRNVLSPNDSRKGWKTWGTIHWLACAIRETDGHAIISAFSKYLDHSQFYRKCSPRTILCNLSSYHSNPIQSITPAYYRNCLTPYLWPLRF